MAIKWNFQRMTSTEHTNQASTYKYKKYAGSLKRKLNKVQTACKMCVICGCGTQYCKNISYPPN